MQINSVPAVVVFLFLAACGSSSSPAAPTTAQLAAEYVAAVAPSNAALDQLSAAVKITPMDGAKIRAAAANLESADVTLNSGFIDFEKKVPASVRPHVEAARVAVSKDIADLAAVVSSTDDAGLIATFNVFAVDTTAASAAFVLLRSDLGLAPPT